MTRLPAGSVAPAPDALEEVATKQGLIGYEGLRRLFAVDGKMPCLRTVKDIVARNPSTLPPVRFSGKLVGFRPATVAKFLAQLEGGRK